MLSIDRSTPPRLRHLIYALHHAAGIASAVSSAPLLRASWGTLLSLPLFGVVLPGRVYRSGSPRTALHYRHVLELGVRTMICVRYGGPSAALREFAERNGLVLRVYDLDHDGGFDLEAALTATQAALDPVAQPVLVCCDGGRHHAGIVVALLRLQMGRSLEDALAEYLTSAAPSPFADNVLFIVRAAREAYALPL